LWCPYSITYEIKVGYLYDQALTNVLEDVLESPFGYLNTVADVNE